MFKGEGGSGQIYLCDPSKPLSIKFTMEGAVFRSGKI